MNNTKQDLRVVKTKKLLYETLEKLITTKSFENIKVSDICNTALINRSTFYSHYGDKYELLEEYINNLKTTLEKELEKNPNISNTKEYYIELLKILLNHVESKKDVYLKIIINNKNSILMDIIYDVINRDINKKFTSNKKEVDEITFKFYLGGIINVCIEWLKSKNAYTKEEIIRHIDKLI